MLVLSRGIGDGISFPDLDLVVEILKVQGKRVQLGISASDTIRVLRSELCERETVANSDASPEKNHALRNNLNALSIGLSIAEKYLQRGDVAAAEGTLENVISKLKIQRARPDLERQTPAVQRRSNPSKSVGTAEKKQARTGKILIVEDNANESQLLSEILSLNGFEVHATLDGNEAMEWLMDHRPDVILMDMHMANCDGPTTVRRIRELPDLETIPIFAVTGATQDDIRTECNADVAVQDWFQKPVKTQPLLHALDELVTQAMRF